MILRLNEHCDEHLRLFVEQIETRTTHDLAPLAKFTLDDLVAMRSALQQKDIEAEARVLD